MKKYQTYLAAAALAAALVPAMEAKAETDLSVSQPSSGSSLESQPVVSETGGSSNVAPETTTPATSEETLSSIPVTETPTEELTQPKEEPLIATTEEKDVDGLIADMTVRQKITHMLMPDFRKWQAEGEAATTDVTVVHDEIAEAIDQYDFGGVILFAENVKATDQTFHLTQALQDAAISNKANNGKIPLLIGIDQEGGIVYRLGSGTALPGNMAIGATDSTMIAKEAGEIIGRELSALGINVDFAPVLDTNNNPNNPVIGLRSFSSDPERVARLGVAMMSGIQDYNVAVAAKHFPGHGDTAVDSHTGLPLVDKSYDQLNALELLPFKVAVENGVDMLMTAHIQYPQIEKDKVISKDSGEEIYIPATLSDDILTGLVRNQYGYEGIIISDAMGMDAIAKNFGETEAALMAIQAGVDIVLMPTVLRSKADLAKIDRIIDAIEVAVQSGQLDESRLDASVKRILTLKEKRGVLNFKTEDKSLETALAQVGSELNRDLERMIAASAVTVVKNDDTILPFKVTEGDHVLLLGAYNNELPGLELGMRRLKADGIIPETVTFEAVRYNNQSTIDQLKEKIDAASHVIVISEIGREAQLAADVWLTKIPTEVVAYANETNKKAAVLSISKPYDVANYPAAKAILAVYGNKGMDPTESLRPDNAFGPNITAGVEVVFNGLKHIGRLPVDIPMIENGSLSDTAIAYGINYGLFYNDPVKQIEVSLPESVPQNTAFSALLNYHSLLGLEKAEHTIKIQINTKHFTAQPHETYTINGDYVIFNRAANASGNLQLHLVGTQLGEAQPILDIVIQDAIGRVFSLEEAANDLRPVYVVKATDDTKEPTQPTEGGADKKELDTKPVIQPLANKKEETSSKQLPSTGQVSDQASLILGLGLGLLALAYKGRREV